jgi:hypothetical protein
MPYWFMPIKKSSNERSKIAGLNAIILKKA